MVDIYLHSKFKQRMEGLSAKERKVLLETLRKLSESPNLEPDRRVETGKGEVCQIVISEHCELVYRVESIETPGILGPGRSTPVAIYAVLQTLATDEPVG